MEIKFNDNAESDEYLMELCDVKGKSVTEKHPVIFRKVGNDTVVKSDVDFKVFPHSSDAGCLEITALSGDFVLKVLFLFSVSGEGQIIRIPANAVVA